MNCGVRKLLLHQRRRAYEITSLLFLAIIPETKEKFVENSPNQNITMSTMKQWVVESKDKDFDGLVYQDAPVPKVGESEVLVKIQAASLNYRDLIIPKACHLLNYDKRKSLQTPISNI